MTHLFLFLFLFLFTPLITLGAEFVPLQDIKGLRVEGFGNFSGWENMTIAGYINIIFGVAIGVGALLAVVQLVRAGFVYMLSGALPSIKGAREMIVAAIGGLILLLSSVLLLQTIDRNITSFSFTNAFPDLEKAREEALQRERQVKHSGSINISVRLHYSPTIIRHIEGNNFFECRKKLEEEKRRLQSKGEVEINIGLFIKTKRTYKIIEMTVTPCRPSN